MPTLPEIPSTRRRRAIWEIFVLGGIERITEHLMRGHEIPDADWSDLNALRQRLRGLDKALDARERAAGAVIEDED